MFGVFTFAKAQVVYEHIDNSAIYLFLDELELSGSIQLNTIAKPYSRKFIIEKLKEADANPRLLTRRQKKELAFYFNRYGIHKQSETDSILSAAKPFHIGWKPPAAMYTSDKFKARALPIASYEYTVNSNQNYKHQYVGALASLEVGNSFGAYFTMVDHASNVELVNPTFLQQRRGAPVRVFVDDYTYTDVYGGFTYNWKWGAVGLVKDHLVWGAGYNGSNILSSSTNPAVPMIKFDMNPVKWLEFHYFHGWLNSNVVENIYTDENAVQKEYMHPRYIAANLIEFKPWSHTNISLGNSLIYGSTGVHPGYLNPFLFYRPVDYQTSDFNDYAGTNGQMYFSASTLLIPHFKFYGNIFIDELSVSEMFSKSDNHNQVSFKLGMSTSGLIKNTQFIFEYTRNNPWTYNHFQKITFFETSNYNLGHYLRENAQDIYTSIIYKPISQITLNASFNKAQKGPEAEQGIYSGLEFLEEVTWDKTTYQFSANYQIFPSLFIYTQYKFQKVDGDQTAIEKYSPVFEYGTSHSLTLGFKMGL